MSRFRDLSEKWRLVLGFICLLVWVCLTWKMWKIMNILNSMWLIFTIHIVTPCECKHTKEDNTVVIKLYLKRLLDFIFFVNTGLFFDWVIQDGSFLVDAWELDWLKLWEDCDCDGSRQLALVSDTDFWRTIGSKEFDSGLAINEWLAFIGGGECCDGDCVLCRFKHCLSSPEGCQE